MTDEMDDYRQKVENRLQSRRKADRRAKRVRRHSDAKTPRFDHWPVVLQGLLLFLAGLLLIFGLN